MSPRRWLIGGGLLSLLLGATTCTPGNLNAIARGAAPDGSRGPDGKSGPDGMGGPDGSVPATCPSPALSPGDTTQTVQVGSATRSYVLHVPVQYDGSKPVPLVLDFHSQASSGQQQRQISPYPSQLDPEGVIMAFPSGLVGPGGASWNLGPCCVSGADDQAFARQLVAQVQKKACIDSRRVYAVGMATGGGMAYALACQAADVFAGIAPSEWDFLEENVAECKPSRTITVVMFRGTANGLVPYGGGYSKVVSTMPITFMGAKASFQKWATLDQCTGPASAEDDDGCSTYSNCAGGVEVILCTKQGGIMEPGTPRISWPVLKQHPLPLP